jgi:pilus assembly protein Flp/PilA
MVAVARYSDRPAGGGAARGWWSTEVRKGNEQVTFPVVRVRRVSSGDICREGCVRYSAAGAAGGFHRLGEAKRFRKMVQAICQDRNGKEKQMNTLKRFFRDERGLELSEYAIMAGLVVLLAVAVIILVGKNINRIFGLLNGKLDQVTST